MLPFIEMVGCGFSIDVLQRGTFTSELVEAFAMEIGQRHQGMRLHRISVNDPISRYETLATRSDVRACILWGLQTEEFTRIFDSNHVACVSLFPRIKISDPRSVVDSPRMVELQLKHLWELGHTRIANLDPVHPHAPMWTHLSRRESYYRLMAERGLRVYPHWVAYGGLDKTTINSAFNQIFSREPYPTAVIVGDEQLLGTYRFLESRGLRIGKDFSVISTDDLTFAALMHPPATSVMNSRRTAAKMTLEMLDKIIDGQEVAADGDIVFAENGGERFP